MAAIALFNRLKQSCVETGEDSEWGRVYSSLFEMPDAPYTTFTRLGYFRQRSAPIERFQDIPSEFKFSKSPTKLFVSHKWESREHPDRSMRTVEQLLSLTQHCDDDAAIWLDYCSLPQRREDGTDDRSEGLKEFFRFQLSLIPLIILDSQCMFLWSGEGVRSGWCCVELLVAHALLHHLNKLVYDRKTDFTTPPLFVTQVGRETVVQSDLVRFDHAIYQKMYCSEVAMQRHQELIGWINTEQNGGKPTPYSQVTAQVTPALISRMVSDHRLTFTNGSDHEVVSRMLYAIYHKLSFEPFNSFKWKGLRDLFSMWHYVKGCLGGCLVPHVAYHF